MYDDIRSWNAAHTTRHARRFTLMSPRNRSRSRSRTGGSRKIVLGDGPRVYLPGGVYTAAHENSANGRVFYYCGERRIATFTDGLSGRLLEDGSSDKDVEKRWEWVRTTLQLGSERSWHHRGRGTIYENLRTVHVAVGGNAHFGGLRDSPGMRTL